jgi:hypothetical protein
MIARPARQFLFIIKFIFMYLKSLNGKSLSAVVMVIIFTFTSCKKDFPPIFKGGHSHSGEPTVLVAGYESNGTFNVAKYWIDGQEIKLSDGTRDASANSMVVSNNDVYIAGSDSGAVYWKNNNEIRLSGDNATSIFVSGNDVYIAGTHDSKAVYWKNGTEIALDITNVYGNFNNAAANSIFVSGKDVYAAGYDGPNAVYWKNGTEIYLTPTTTTIAGYVHTYSVYVKGSDVYVVGYSNFAGSVFPMVWFWKNDVLVPFGQVGTDGQGNAVLVSGSDVYVAGMEVSAPAYLQTAAYWKNGNVVLLPGGGLPAYAKSIFVSGNDVYLAGFEDIAFQMSYAVYWKDGVETKLTDGTHAATANSIVVK